MPEWRQRAKHIDLTDLAGLRYQKIRLSNKNRR